MDSVERSAVTPSKNKLARTIAKVLHIRAVTGIAPVEGAQKVKPQESIKHNVFQKVMKSHENGKDDTFQQYVSSQKLKDDGVWKVKPQGIDDWFTRRHIGARSVDEKEDEYQERLAFEALVCKLFASVSSVKSAYAQLQYAQSPYNADEIQAADKKIVSECKNLSELKQCFLKKQFDPLPEKAIKLAEIKEQNSLLKTFEITVKKLESQLRLKDSEIVFLREKLEEAKKQNRSIEKKLNQSGQLYMFDQLHLSGLSPHHFNTVLRHALKYIRCFVRLMIDEMKTAGWDIDAAAMSIDPSVAYWKPDHKCFAFESFVCKEMFSAFHQPNFSLPNESIPENIKLRHLFFQRFTGFKSVKPKDYLKQNPRSTFAKFCRAKYLTLIHPRMEASLFGNLNQRNLVNSGQFPETPFFATFAEMANKIWLLHCLAFSFDPEASIFQVQRGCRFSEVYMESITDHEGDSKVQLDPQVSLLVVPGFKIDKTVIQCQVYLSQLKRRRNC